MQHQSKRTILPVPDVWLDRLHSRVLRETRLFPDIIHFLV
jgi:hypothetical protein